MSYAKASTPPRQQGELSRPSWPASQYWSSNWAASAAPHPENPVAPGICRPPNPEAQPRTARTVFETLVRDFSATAIELHGKASSTEAQQVCALGAVGKPVIDEARAERIYAEVRALADSYVMPD